jgi:hypothetical protein
MRVSKGGIGSGKKRTWKSVGFEAVEGAGGRQTNVNFSGGVAGVPREPWLWVFAGRRSGVIEAAGLFFIPDATPALLSSYSTTLDIESCL